MNLGGSRSIKNSFSPPQAQQKTTHFIHNYMVRSTLLHLCILVGPSGSSGPFEFSYYLCVKS